MSDYDNALDLPLFRATNPQTSKQASEHIQPKASALRAEFMRCLRSIGRPATAQEVASVCNAAIRESVRKRAAECNLVKVGTKKCDVTGQRAAVYWFRGSNEPEN